MCWLIHFCSFFILLCLLLHLNLSEQGPLKFCLLRRAYWLTRNLLHAELIKQAWIELAHASTELHIVVAVGALHPQSRLYCAVVFAKGLARGVMSAIITLPRVNFSSSPLSAAHASLVLQHAENLSFGLVVSHAAHCDQLNTSLIISLSSLLEVVSLALVHYQDYSVVHGGELFVREARRIHFKLRLADVGLVLRNGIAAT